MKKETCYHGGSSISVTGLDYSRLDKKKEAVRSDVTDAWYDPAPEVVNTIKENLNWLLKNSPPTHAEGVIKTISEVRGIPEDHLIVGGGSSDLMYTLFENIPFESALILDPMYGEYEHIFSNVLGKKVKKAPQRPENDFNISVKELIKRSEYADIIVIVNPNSPTGKYLTRKEIEELVRNIPKKKIIIDETYIDYIGAEESVEKLVPKNHNLIVIKSLSKVYALSGARAAYLVAPRKIIRELRPHNPPWPVGGIGQLSAIKALKNEEYYKRKIQETHQLRKELSKELKKIPDIKVYDGSANFIFLEIKETGLEASTLCKALKKEGIYVRDTSTMTSQKDLRGRYLRMAVRDETTNKKVCEKIKEAITKGKKT